jgi:spore coat protein A
MKRIGIALGAVVALASVVHADTANLVASRDNTMFSEDGTLSNGAGEYFFAGKTNDGNPGTIRRGLIAFDLSSIPAGSVITDVQVRLYFSRGKNGNHAVSLHRCLADWGEGTSNADAEEGQGAPATTNDATWTHRFYNTTTWSTAGGQYAPTSSASIIVNGAGQFVTWGTTAQMVADVQAWLDAPASNFGWAVVGVESSNRTARRFDSRTNPTVANRPTLIVTFTPPAGTGACCFADGACQILTGAQCGAASGTYQGDGTSCDPTPCPQPDIACCFDDGTCADLTAADCLAATGNPEPYPSACASTSCPILIGACCFNDGSCSEVTQTDCAALSGAFEAVGTDCLATVCPVVLTKWLDALPIPGAATPTSGFPGGVATYDIEIQQVQQQLHTDLPPTTVWGYEGLFPGPTIEAYRDDPVTVNWINDLRDGQGVYRTDHYFQPDLCPHGAEDLPKVVTHLHGGHVPPAADGYPEHTFLPGASATYVYPNNQEAATLWCHDHALGITRLNVIMGLAMFYILRDDNESSLNLPSGEFEIPIAIQDRTFHPDGSFNYPAEQWHDHFFGDTFVVNGKAWPYLNVKQGKYRFRLLNGCTSRTVTLALSTGAPFTLIGLEMGLLESPVSMTELTIAPGERRDVIVDFASYGPGTEIILTNSAPIPYTGAPGSTDLPEVMKFFVQNAAGDTDPVPSTLNTIVDLNPMDAVTTRYLTLAKSPDPCTGMEEWLINGMHWDHIDEFPVLGSTEIWAFANDSGIMHPMHMHLVAFQVLDRDTFTKGPNGEIIPGGAPVAPGPDETGWKDTVQVNANELVRVIARFDDYTGKYPYHCHILEHEDHEMMRQFEVVAPSCVGDINGDGSTNAADFVILAGNFGTMVMPHNTGGDLNGDGLVNASDFVILAGDFGCQP